MFIWKASLLSKVQTSIAPEPVWHNNFCNKRRRIRWDPTIAYPAMKFLGTRRDFIGWGGYVQPVRDF